MLRLKFFLMIYSLFLTFFLFALRVINFGLKQMRPDILRLLELYPELITCTHGSLELLEITNTTKPCPLPKVLFLFSPFPFFQLQNYLLKTQNNFLQK